MAIGDRRYRLRVPRDVQNLIDEEGLPTPDVYTDPGERPPYLSYSARAILFGDPIPQDLADQLGVPVDIGESLAKARDEHARTNGTNGHSHPPAGRSNGH
jgi:hypothetical protein